MQAADAKSNLLRFYLPDFENLLYFSGNLFLFQNHGVLHQARFQSYIRPFLYPFAAGYQEADAGIIDV